MRKIIFTLSTILASLLLLALLLVLALHYWFNPNTLVAPLSNQLQQKTGLVLRVNGKLSWHIFPRAHITVEQVSLQPTDPKQNSTDIRIETLKARLSLWPLITEKKLIIDDITLDGLDLTLQDYSLQALKKNSAQPVVVKNTPVENTSTPSTKKSIGFAVKSITLNDVTVHGILESVRPNTTLYLDHFTIKNLDSSSSVKTIPIDMTARIVNNGNTLPVSLNSTVVFDASKHSIRTDDLQASINTLTVQGHLSANKTSASTEWQGQLTLDDEDAANTVYLLTGADNTPIKTLQGVLTLAANQQEMTLSPFNLKLNGDTLTGSATYNFKQHHLNSVLNADTVHWSTNSSPAAVAPAAKNNAPAIQAPSTVASTPQNNSTAFSMDSQLRIQHLLYNTLALDNISGQLHYANQSISLNPITVTMLQGLYQGKAALALDSTHKLIIEGTLSHLDLTLLQQYLGMKPSVTGLLDVKGALSTQGQSQQQRLANLNGNISVAITKGSWTHLDMTNILGLLNLANSKHTLSTGNTFSSVSGDFTIRNGVATNPNLKLISPLLSAKGDGSLNLVKQTLNYQVLLRPDASVLEQVNGLSQWLKQDIPLTIKGPWADPKIQLNQGALIRTKVQDQLDDTLKRVRGLIILR